jgi:rhodanese-related sulfurtransferase
MTENRSTPTRVLFVTLVLSLLAVAGLLAGCGGKGVPAAGDAAVVQWPGHLKAVEAKAFFASHPGMLILDVRNPDEWNDNLGHIDGAKQVPLPELHDRLAELAAWKDKPVVAVCKVGGRSAQASDLLVQAGFKQVWNLEGGMEAWRAAGY